MSGIDERHSRHDELQRFKREIDLARFAEQFGYKLTERSGAYRRLRRGPGDQIIVARARDGSFVYVNPTNCATRDPSAPKPSGVDQGTIIDFLQREQRIDLSEVRRQLRAYLGQHPDDRPPLTELLPSFDRAAVARQLESYAIADYSQYLATRGIRPQTLADDRFVGTVRSRANGEIAFPHHDQTGITGFERKHPRYTLFSRAGRRALWHSRLRSTDCKLVVAESAIDCLSYHQLQQDRAARYMSTGGTLSALQQELIGRAIAKLPPDGQLVIASDNDRAGRQIAAVVGSIAARVRRDVAVEQPLPPDGLKDWNDVLQHRESDFIRQAKSDRALTR
jgi:DNA primase